MRGGGDRRLAGWLLAVALAQLVVLEGIRRFFVGTARGQRLDTAALTGNSIGRGQVSGVVNSVLDAVSVLSVLAAVLAIGFIALVRGRVLLGAVATAMVIGANLTTQALKVVVERPELGIDVARVGAGNSLPSGHTTVTASVAVALVLVLPAAVRGIAAVAGAGVVAVVGVATLSAGWHRPSDAVAALLVVGVWAAVAGLVLVVARTNDGRDAPPDDGGAAHRMGTLTLVLAGVASLVVAAMALAVTDSALRDPVGPVVPEQLSQTQLFVAYAGGAAGIAGVTCMVVALVLVTVHRVAGRRG